MKGWIFGSERGVGVKQEAQGVMLKYVVKVINPSPRLIGVLRCFSST